MHNTGSSLSLNCAPQGTGQKPLSSEDYTAAVQMYIIGAWPSLNWLERPQERDKTVA
jgi:hypothetical protein